jgi:hypothetical protein
MSEFKTNLELGKKAYVVRGSFDFWIEEMTVGQVRVTRTLPHARPYNDECYTEEYMCIETGVGSGNVYKYGKNIFANEKDAQAGVIKHQQIAYKKRAEREKYLMEQEEYKRRKEIAQLKKLKEKYESNQVA